MNSLSKRNTNSMALVADNSFYAVNTLAELAKSVTADD